VIALCCLAVIVVAVILGLTGAYADILGFLPFLSPQTATPKIIPIDAGFVSTVKLNVGDLEGYQHLAEVYEDAFEDELADSLEEMEDTYDISFEEDIQTWLGAEMSIAILNLEEATENALQPWEMGENPPAPPSVVFAVATRDREASSGFLEKLKASIEDEDYNVEEETYKDVTFYVQEVEEEWETPTVFGTVGDFVVMTSDVDSMEAIIDTYKGEMESLAQNEYYLEVMKELPGDASMYVFVNIQDLAPALEDYAESGDLTGGLDATGMDMDGYKAFGMAATLDVEGVQIDTIVTFDPDELSTDNLELLTIRNQASSGDILTKVSDDMLVFVSARDLASIWRTYLETNSELEEQLKDMSAYLGIDVDSEFFAWATGEFSLAITEARDEIGFFAIFEVSDPDEALNAIDDLAEDFAEESGVEFEQETIGGIEMQVLIDPYSEEIMLGYGIVDNYLIVGFTEDALEKGAEGDANPISDDEMFKKVTAHLPQNNIGYVYINVDAIVDAIGEDAGPWLEPIEAIVSAQAVADLDKGFAKSTAYIYIP
jgi:hypothetical protein